MAYNGSGTFSLPSGNPVVTGTVISSTWANLTLSQIATGLSTAILKDGTQTVTQDIPLATHKFTGLSAGSAAGNSLRYEQLLTAGLLTLLGTLTVPSTLGVGAATPSASGAGVTFPATQSASTDANTLDDYEEGTWTPVLSFSTPGNLAVAYTTQVGSYTKIGRAVFVNFSILTSSFVFTTSSGTSQINGLPFTSNATAGYVWTGALAWEGITKANYTDINSALTTAGSALFFYASGSGQTLSTVSQADTTSTVTQYRYGSLNYIV